MAGLTALAGCPGGGGNGEAPPATTTETDSPTATDTETPTVAADGSWGPIDVDGEARYEFVVARAGDGAHHFYREPALRSNHFVRLLTSEPGRGIDSLVERGPDHAALVITRDKEFWGAGDATDSLEIDGTEVLHETTAPRGTWRGAVIVYDANSDGDSNPAEPIPAFDDLGVITAVDVSLPAASPPDDAIVIESEPRDGDGLVRTVPVRNWASDQHAVSVHLPDHVQTR